MWERPLKNSSIRLQSIVALLPSAQQLSVVSLFFSPPRLARYLIYKQGAVLFKSPRNPSCLSSCVNFLLALVLIIMLVIAIS